MNKKNTIRLTESELKKVISESVKKVLKESYESESELALRTYPMIYNLYDTWSEVRDGSGRYSETASQVAGALRNVIEVLRNISKDNKRRGISGYDFSHFHHPEDGGYDY